MEVPFFWISSPQYKSSPNWYSMFKKPKEQPKNVLEVMEALTKDQEVLEKYGDDYVKPENLELLTQALEKSTRALVQLMIFVRESPPDQEKEVRWRSMFNKSNQKMISFYCKDLSSFNTELVMELHTLGCMYHFKACQQIVDARSKVDLLHEVTLKAAYALFKKAAQCFEFIHMELLKQGTISVSSKMQVPEVTYSYNLVMAKLSQTHGIMTALENAINSAMKPEMLAKICRNIADNMEMLLGDAKYFETVAKENDMKLKDFTQPTYYDWVSYLKDLYMAMAFAYHGKHLWGIDKQREAMGCARIALEKLEMAEKGIKEHSKHQPKYMGSWSEKKLVLVKEICDWLEKENKVFFASAVDISRIPEIESKNFMPDLGYILEGFDEMMGRT